MSATKILWGQVTAVFAIVLIAVWAATQWTAWRLGYQPQLGQPWFELWRGAPVYLPPGFLLVVVRLRRLRAAHFYRGGLYRGIGRIHLDRGRHRHVGLACTRGEERGYLWHSTLGDAA